jgi:formimidoylglutamate deiminase
MVAKRPFVQRLSHCTPSTGIGAFRSGAAVVSIGLSSYCRRRAPSTDPIPMTMQTLFAEAALLPDGWASDVLFEVAPDGSFAQVVPNAAEHPQSKYAHRLAGPVLPGMPNLHSHAFQRAMAGLAERVGQCTAGEDDFWTWRQVMYDFVGKLTPGQAEAIAAQLYVEMLKAGYTAVAEFHYVHHNADGSPFANRAEMSERIVAAAQASGIGLTLLPVLYAHGGFGGQPPAARQRRFLHDVNSFLRLIEGLIARHRGDPRVRVGIAPHSLRAVTPDSLSEVVSAVQRLESDAPIHIHVAEQAKEVEECLGWCNRRPVEWLLDHQPVDRRWCLVHATQTTEAEVAALARSGAVAGLCPSTEANLGDGFFPARDFLRQGGIFGIGSDSHVSVSPVEELRWLEYGQRLRDRRRNVLASDGPSVGAGLYRRALAGGAQALGRPLGRLARGCRADLLVVDAEVPALIAKSGDVLLDAIVFAGNANPVRDVMVGGRWVVEEGHHIAEHAVFARFKTAMAKLLE